ncbi:MAG TPA: carbamoyl-phosphate synthase domain-containing protein, partial [Bacillales bacterium]|nr:carbamoyl-phosphate synthase domain-containing protein [Bacillales bacterium]
MKRQLILEDGSIFIGNGFGSDSETEGEVVFTTGMTGYQETLSDPSYCAQIVTFTYPLIGNYGINRDDFESIEPAIHGVIVKEAARHPSHWKAETSLDELLRAKDIPGLEGIDTRKLTRKIREHGTLKGKICSVDVSADEIIESLKRKSFPHDQVSRVSTKNAYSLPGRGKRVV